MSGFVVLKDLRDKRSVLWQYASVANIPDTHRLINSLTQHGFSADQAEGIIEAIHEIDLSSVATKGDLHELGARLTTRMVTFHGVTVAVLGLLTAVFNLLS